MKTIKLFIALMTLTILSSCAHSVMRGTVAMKTSSNEGHVCLGQGEVKTGDRVTLLKNVCTGQAASIDAGSTGRTCQLEQLGMGTVQNILSDHYSVVKFDAGVPFEEGTLVERR